MGLPIHRTPSRLPRRFPVGATYVVEGYGGEAGDLRVIARYVVLPGGRRINVPADLSSLRSPRALPFRRRSNSKQSQAKGRIASGGKNSLVGEEPVSGPGVDCMAPGEAPQPLTLNHPALSPGRVKRPGFSYSKRRGRVWTHLFGNRLKNIRPNRGLLFGPDDQIVAMNHLRAAAKAEN